MIALRPSWKCSTKIWGSEVLQLEPQQLLCAFVSRGGRANLELGVFQEGGRGVDRVEKGYGFVLSHHRAHNLQCIKATIHINSPEQQRNMLNFDVVNRTLRSLAVDDSSATGGLGEPYTDPYPFYNSRVIPTNITPSSR